MNIIPMARSSPFYLAYEAQKELFDQAIDQAIKESSEKMSKSSLNELFSIINIKSEKKAA